MIFEKQIEAMYRKNLFTRQDNQGEIFYFAPGDFPGLMAHDYSFKSGAGHDLKGYFHFMEHMHSGVVNDYAMWVVAAMAFVLLYVFIFV